MSSYYHDYSEQLHKPGYVYAIEAVGFGGLIPGLWSKRVKIGVSNSPNRRVNEFVAGQPPCDFWILHTVYVADMATVESELHQIFAYRNVKLERSKEWFALTPWELRYLFWLMNRYASGKKGINWKQAAIALGVAFALGSLLATSASQIIQEATILPVREEVKTGGQ